MIHRQEPRKIDVEKNEENFENIIISSTSSIWVSQSYHKKNDQRK